MAFRAAASDSSQAGLTVDILGSNLTGLAVGDVMIGGIYHRATSPPTPPTNWTQFGPTQEIRTPDGVTLIGRLLCYRKVAEAGDGSATFTWTMANANAHMGIICAFSGRDTAAPITDVQGFSNTSSLQTIDAPDVTIASGVDLVSFCTIGTQQTTYTPPSELTERVDFSDANGAGGSFTGATADAVASGTVGSFTVALGSGWNRMAAITVAVAAAAVPTQQRRPGRAYGWF